MHSLDQARPAMPGDGSFSSTGEQRRRGRGSGGVTGKGFQPGVSGSPGGRPRADVTELARAHTREAIEALVAALKRPKQAVPAAIALLDRGWGKPAQTIHAQSEATVLHLLAARQSGDELLKRLTTPVVDGDAVERETQQIVNLAALPLPEE